jgi:hypothetical protein
MLSVIMLSVIMPGVIMLSVIMLNVLMLSVIMLVGVTSHSIFDLIQNGHFRTFTNIDRTNRRSLKLMKFRI